jgi:Kdo2-lipid IVA lauroyltransferase/acyltransferase
MIAGQSNAVGVPPLPWWVKVLSRVPLPVLYAVFAALVFLARVVFRMRLGVVRANIRDSFPERGESQRARMVRDHYSQVGQMLAEVLRGASMSRAAFAQRVRVKNLALAQSMLELGRPVLLVAAHQGNWEWVLQAMALQLGYPLDVGYKPIKSAAVDRTMNAIRCRFGAHLVPAKQLLGDLLQRRHIVRGIAMLADQEPTTSDHQHWVKFLGRDTAFYMGPEQMVRATRYGALFVALRRLRRGYYEIEFLPLSSAGEQLERGVFTERYARLVEQEIVAAPSDWTWGHRRWKLKRSVYAD